MSQPFNPQEHLIKLPKRVKDTQTGQWVTRYDDYLEVKWRLCWFRDRYPHGTIETEELCVDLDRGYARYKARVTDGEGGSATGHGTETKADFADYCERAETRALGRALAAMGIGTQFVGAELDELPHVADAPVTTTTTAAPDTPHEATGRPHPLPVGEDGTPGAATNGHRPAPEPDEGLAHPTEAHLSALRTLALDTCRDDIEAFETRVRRTAGLPAHASLAPKLLSRTLSMKTYMEVYGWYVNLEKQLAKGKETPRAEDTTTQPTPQPAPAATGESLPAVPPPGSAAESSSATSDPNDANERERIVREAMDAGIPEKEARHIVTHHALKAAHSLLLAAAKKRLQAA